MHEVLVNRLGGLSLPRKSVVRLTDRPDMTLDVYRGRKTTMQQKSAILVSCGVILASKGSQYLFEIALFLFSGQFVPLKKRELNYLKMN